MGLQSPARLVLEKAVAVNRENGHENLGALSEEFGFMPMEQPKLELPESHRLWDDLARQLPTLHLNMTLRRVMEEMPVLQADADNLPSEYLLRAALILSVFAHSYWWVDNDRPESVPASIQQPWEQVTRRLARPEPFMPYTDYFLYNWQLLDPKRADPMRLENLALSVPVVGNTPERIFVLAQVEVNAQCSPIVGAVMRAQEAIIADDSAALRAELLIILERLQHITNHSLQKLDTNPHSASYVDPVLWSKTVARYAIPIKDGVQGPSGTSAPVFQLLDVFFGRARYDSVLGQDTLKYREWFPIHHRQFLEAVAKVSTRDYVEMSRDECLKGIFQTTMEAYVGEKGFLGAHRLKVYGFLETAYKVGRNSTAGGFKGNIKDRRWRELNLELDWARQERYDGAPTECHFGRVVSCAPTDEQADGNVKHVVIDTRSAHVVYSPGDRVGIMPENSGELVAKTLQSLEARGAEPIKLDNAWRQMWPHIAGVFVEVLPLTTLLRYARIRPVQREVAKALFNLSANAKIQEILHQRSEDQWELWDFLDALAASGFDTRRLWKAEPWEPESICKIAPPPLFRMYSIASAMGAVTDDTADELELTVNELEYETKESFTTRAETRFGTVSTSLNRKAQASKKAEPQRWGLFSEVPDLTIKVVHPSRFHLPSDPQTPVVMFAAGAGIAPFRGFMMERTRRAGGGENWLFLGARNQKQFLYREEIERWVGAGILNFRIAFSGEAIAAAWNGDSGRFDLVAGEPAHVSHVMLSDPAAAKLWDLLRSKEDGGQGACFYVCGSSSFAVSVMTSVKAVIAKFASGADLAEREEQGRRMLRTLMAGNRYMQDIFTTYSAVGAEEPLFQVSEIVLHNNQREGYWTVIDGRVYDLGEFVNLHAGGDAILRENSGMDASHAYKEVQHHVNSEVHAMLGMFEIGAMKRLDFANAWGVAVGKKGLRTVSLESAFKSWIRFLYLLVELENALSLDYASLEHALTNEADGSGMSPLKIQLILDTHDRFAINCLDGAFNGDLRELWATTIGLCAPGEKILTMEVELIEIFTSPEADQLIECEARLRTISAQLRDGQVSAADMEQIERYCAAIASHDLAFLSSMKMAIRDCVLVFEKYEKDAVTHGKEELLAGIKKIPGVVMDYYVSTANATRVA